MKKAAPCCNGWSRNAAARELRSANLLTGKRYVALDYFADGGKDQLDLRREPLELPVVVSTLPDFEAKLASLLAKLDRLRSSRSGRPEERPGNPRQTMKNVDKTLPGVQATLRKRAAPSPPFDRLATNADTTLLGPNAPAQQELRDALREVTAAARALRVLADSIERHPESLSAAGPTTNEASRAGSEPCCASSLQDAHPRARAFVHAECFFDGCRAALDISVSVGPVSFPQR